MRLATWVLVAAMASAYAAPCLAITDCSKPKTKIDWMLCSSERATMEEQRMTRAFREAANRVQDRRKLLDDQQEWTIKVRDQCNEIACLLKVYQERTEELGTY